MSHTTDRRTAILLDQQPLWMDAVEQVAQRAGVTVVLKTSSVAEALEHVAVAAPDLLIMDTSLDDGRPAGDIEALRQVREHASETKLMVLTAIDDRHCVDAAFAAGADAYVLKTTHPDDLASAMRQVFRHSMYLAAPAQDPARLAPGAAEPEPPLTRREAEILQLLAEGLSNAQLARELWVTEQTVKFHLSNIYRKLAVANRTEASRWAQRNGLIETPSVPVIRAVS